MTALTDEEKRVRIAEACPTIFDVRQGQIYWKGELNEVQEREWLHAMHEAEKTLTKPERYIKRLFDVVYCDQGSLGTAHIWHATARQRAEAFGRTLGLW